MSSRKHESEVGGVLNQEIVSFRSCVRMRGLVAQWIPITYYTPPINLAYHVQGKRFYEMVSVCVLGKCLAPVITIIKGSSLFGA